MAKDAESTGGNSAKVNNPTVNIAAALISALLISFTGLSFFGQFFIAFELLSHFAFQFALGLLPFTVYYLKTKKYAPAGFCAAALTANLIHMAPLFIPVTTSPGPADLKVLQYNINSHNRALPGLVAFIEAVDADIVCLEEVRPETDEYLRANIPGSFTTRISVPRRDNFGIAVYSKLPFDKLEAVSLSKAEIPSIKGSFEIAGKKAHLICTHPLPPIDTAVFDFRNEQLARLAELVNTLDGPVVLAGDLNATPYSFYFQKLLSETGLHDSGRGRGLRPTWPAGLPVFDIPIDHILVKGGLITVSREVLDGTGSDHRAVLGSFKLEIE
ncbi:MAG: endonuclease/exonuclease/phosphatase family protein [Candidatus Melainabacteria bacterium]|nr:endonuclease/exonuclease/phosphatase family protein [Candidatus Melainabacteria bacterium]